MKRAGLNNCKALANVRLALSLAAAMLLPLFLYGGAPTWWSQRGVLVENAAADDYAPANQGQLKNIAKAAVVEMDAKLNGGAGDSLHDLVNTWATPNPQTNDFAPVNLGQLKNIAQPFYDRLIAAGLADYDPWLSSLNLPDDFAAANIGQLKKLFAFDIPAGNLLNDPLGDRLAAGVANLAVEPNAVWIWADGLGGGNDFQRNYPRRLTDFSNVTSVAAGEVHLLALHGDGTVSVWGHNSSGQLGDGTNMSRDIPTRIANLAGIISVKAGSLHNLALRSDGTVLAWGDNSYGQLGNGGTDNAATPSLVIGLTDVRRIAAGQYGSVALRGDGTVWTWGYRYYPGFGPDLYDTVPTIVPGLSDVVDVAKGFAHTVAVKSDGTVWAWGANYANQIGHVDVSPYIQETPFQIPTLSNVKRVVSNMDHTLALTNDGIVWAWGYNSSGQLGDGTNQPRQSPVKVIGMTDVIAIAVNSYYSLAMKADGTVWVWGGTAAGTLPTDDLFTPRQVTLGLLDTNHNGMDDRWEVAYLGSLDQAGDADLDGDGISNFQEFLRRTDPRDYFNGSSPVLEIIRGNDQLGDPGTLLPKPLTVRVKAASGQVLVNAPVQFRVSSGSGLVTSRPGEALQDDVIVRTDALGEASAYVMLPQAPGTSVRIAASPLASGSGDPTPVATTTFRASARFVLLSPTPSPDPNASPTPSPSPTASPPPPYRYAIIDLGKDMHPRRINNQGWILLNGYDADGNWSSYRWKGGTLERLDYSGSYSNLVAADMNDTGAAVGSFSYEGPWGVGTERETGGGLFWPPGRSTADKLSGSGSYPGFGRAAGLSFRVAGASAVNNANDTFGTMCTGTAQGFLFSTLLVMNSAEWPSGSGSAIQLSNASASNADNTTTFFPAWGGSIDTISRANAAGHYIGSKLTNLYANPFGVSGTTTGMIDGQSVSFNPADINEAGIVVGSAGADMVVSSSPNSQTTISGASPLAINDHTRPAPSPSGQSSPAPNPSSTPIPVPQILAWAGEALVLWERQQDGHTWHPFGLEEMIPTMDGWQYLEPYDLNDAGAIIGRAWYTDPSNPHAQGEYHAFLLVSVELRDIKGEGDADDQVLTTMDPAPIPAPGESDEVFWRRSNSYYQQQVPDSSIAYIEPHSGPGGSPSMPRLVARLPYNLERARVKWRLEVDYPRLNGWRAAYTDRCLHLEEDLVRIPTAPLSQPATFTAEMSASQEWRIFESQDWQNEITQHGFFGGTAKLYVWFPSQEQSAPEQPAITFRIGGRNPDPDLTKSFIQGNLCDNRLWFAYAIAKKESRDYDKPFYNQFFSSYRKCNGNTYDENKDWQCWAKGWPVYNIDRGSRHGPMTSAGGYGIFQVTGDARSQWAVIPRRQIWNWQDNVGYRKSSTWLGAMGILKAKIQYVDSLYNNLQQTYPNCGAIPNYPLDVTSTRKRFSGWDAFTCKGYNGYGGSQPQIDVNGFKKAQWSTWHPRGNHWAFVDDGYTRSTWENIEESN
jgi:alpha-tubulin suppressor-like RCC1 family protein